MVVTRCQDNKYPELSEALENMMFENKYENRVKGNREGEDVVKAMTNSLTKRLEVRSCARCNVCA